MGTAPVTVAAVPTIVRRTESESAIGRKCGRIPGRSRRGPRRSLGSRRKPAQASLHAHWFPRNRIWKAANYDPEHGRVGFWQYRSCVLQARNDGNVPRPSGRTPTQMRSFKFTAWNVWFRQNLPLRFRDRETTMLMARFRWIDEAPLAHHFRLVSYADG